MTLASLLADVRAEVSGARALDTVRTLARLHRVQASPGYDEAAEWIVERLEDYGLGFEVERVPGDGHTRFLGQLMPRGWVCERATADLIDGERRERLCDYDAECLSLVLRSAPAQGRFALVAVEGGGRPEDYDGVDVRGKVVLVAGPVRRALELAVRARGAAGLLVDGRRLVPPVRDAWTDPDQVAYTSFWWAGDEPRGWGFVVSPRVGARLRERLRAGAVLELDVAIESEEFATEIPLVSAVLPGDGPREILVLSHLCHPRPSAHDNASGAASLLETARVLAELRRRGRWSPGPLGVRLLWMPELTGTFAWLGRDPGRIERIVGALNLDMVGARQDACGSVFLLEHPPCFSASYAEELLSKIRHAAVDSVVTSFGGAGSATLTRMAEVPYSGGSDHAVFVDPSVAVPCPMLIHWPDRFYHSSHDTPDKVDPDSLALTVRCAATWAAWLAAAGEADRPELLDVVARGARRRLFEALEGDDPERRVSRERVRAHAAIASLFRVGVPQARIDDARRAFDSFLERETAALRLAPATPPDPNRALGAATQTVPKRRKRGPLDFLDHLMDGWGAQSIEQQEAWRALKSRVPESVFELAWFACDGRRSVAEIARLVWIESGHWEPEAVAEFFAHACDLGLASAPAHLVRG
jgi:hypothetical protein